MSGTQGIAGAADAVLVLSRSRGAASAVLKVTGRDVEEAEYALDFAADVGAWQLLDGPAGDYETTDQRRRILVVLRAEGGLGPKQIAQRAELSHDVVKQLVRKMVDAGQLDTDGAGRYFPLAHSLRSPRSPDAVNGERVVESRSLETEALTCTSERGEQGERPEAVA